MADARLQFSGLLLIIGFFPYNRSSSEVSMLLMAG